MKKGRKIRLIVGGSLLVAGGTRVGLTKTGVIPNWFEIEALCPNTKIFLRNPFVIENDYKLDYNGDWKNQFREDGTHKDYKDYENDLDLSQTLKSMGLRATGCPNIFCQQVADDGTYKNQKHYYWDSEKKEMILIPNVYYVSDCSYYDKLFIENKGFDISLSIESGGYNNLLWQVKQKANDEDFTEHVHKPIIYLYPTIETEVYVGLGKSENLSHTYPKYDVEKGWNVVAQPNGDLEDIETGRKLYALYREGRSNNETNFDEGFVVAGKDIIPFLEEKLAILGLNEREAEEFIVYWLPQMENNEWNLVRFESIEEQDENMPLNITPTPDTLIRVMMDWKTIDEPIDIQEQQLTTPERSGFTVVEWGGSPRN